MTAMRNDAASTRDEIMALVGRYHQERHTPRPFDPARDSVRYAGRVFGAEELQLLVDSSLDFYLTASRFTASETPAPTNGTTCRSNSAFFNSSGIAISG